MFGGTSVSMPRYVFNTNIRYLNVSAVVCFTCCSIHLVTWTWVWIYWYFMYTWMVIISSPCSKNVPDVGVKLKSRSINTHFVAGDGYGFDVWMCFLMLCACCWLFNRTFSLRNGPVNWIVHLDLKGLFPVRKQNLWSLIGIQMGPSSRLLLWSKSYYKFITCNTI